MNSLARQIKRRKQRLSKSHVPGHQYGRGNTAMSIEDLEWLKGNSEFAPHVDFMNALNDLKHKSMNSLLLPGIALVLGENISKQGEHRPVAVRGISPNDNAIIYQGWKVAHRLISYGQRSIQQIMIEAPIPWGEVGFSNKEAGEYLEAIREVFFESHSSNNWATQSAGPMTYQQDIIPPWILGGCNDLGNTGKGEIV